MKLIAAVDRKWAIGCGNKLLASVPEDMRFFRETTTGNIVVMGRKTLESFPGGRPLKNRTNILLTANKDYVKEGAIIVHSPDELQRELEKYDGDRVYVIGGGSIYKMLEPFCDTAYITKLDNEYEADTYFPDLDESPDWSMSYQGPQLDHEGLKFTFTTYTRNR